MSGIRPFRRGDEAALAEICLRTADAGADATGLLPDDDLWAAVFVLPYAARHPAHAAVVEADDGRVVGYVVAAPDTDAFETWFRDTWWPPFAERWPHPGTQQGRDAAVRRYAWSRGPGVEPYAAAYPAHLHIDLLPEAQGQGWGRRLIETAASDLRAAGVRGVHLVASADNTGAVAFYPRVGFAPLPSGPDVRAFGRLL